MSRTILKKTEKIASAIYLITSFFNEKEPLKWELRSLSSQLIGTAFFLKDEMSATEEPYREETKRAIALISSLLMVAKNAGLVSEMNYEILAKEIDKFSKFLAKSGENADGEDLGVLSEHFFSGQEKALEAPKREDAIKDKIRIPSATSPEKAIKPKPLRDFGTVAVKKNTRQGIIINLLKRKKEIMIKDVSSLIEGVSEKTIQRELLAMVKAGIIKKEGEKRWSRYSLA